MWIVAETSEKYEVIGESVVDENGEVIKLER